VTRHPDITAVILAGGRGSRMGGADKGLVDFKGRPLIAHVIDTVAGQVGALLINANRNRDRYAEFGYRVVNDTLEEYQGPLAGFLAAMQTAQTRDILTLPCDGPLISDDLAERLLRAREREQAEIAVAHDGRRLQPVYALVPVALRESLQAYLDGGDRTIDLWYTRHRLALADFSDIPASFVNINTIEEREQLSRGDAL
jgi:molybdenum cofactor guanylyltransferase